MKTKRKLIATRTGSGRLPRNLKKFPGKRERHVECLHRAGPSEFTCGIDDVRALLVEESLDEREKRG